jgi:hypothetical protein
MKSTIFWAIMLCSALKDNRHFVGTYCLHLQGQGISRARNQRESMPPAFILVSCSAYSSTLKMEAMFLRNVGWQRTTRCYIPEESTLHNHRCENLKSYRMDKCSCIYRLLSNRPTARRLGVVALSGPRRAVGKRKVIPCPLSLLARQGGTNPNIHTDIHTPYKLRHWRWREHTSTKRRQHCHIHMLQRPKNRLIITC